MELYGKIKIEAESVDPAVVKLYNVIKFIGIDSGDFCREILPRLLYFAAIQYCKIH